MTCGYCDYCHKPKGKLVLCFNQKCLAKYCSRKCSDADRPAHKAQCNKIRGDKFNSRPQAGTELLAHFMTLDSQLPGIITAAACEILWCPEHIDPDTGRFMRYLQIKYTHEMKAVPCFSTTAERDHVVGDAGFLTSRVPVVQDIDTSESLLKKSTSYDLVYTRDEEPFKVLPIIFEDTDTHTTFETYLLGIAGTPIKHANRPPFVDKLNEIILGIESRRPADCRDLRRVDPEQRRTRSGRILRARPHPSNCVARNPIIRKWAQGRTRRRMM